MLKNIPKSNISVRDFKTYKEWEFTESTYPIVSASLEDGEFYTSSAANQNGLYIDPLYTSIKSKYYSNTGNPFTLFGITSDIGYISSSRRLSDEILVISVDRDYYGEEMKPGTISISDETNGLSYYDDSYGGILSTIPSYLINTLDTGSDLIVISDNNGIQYSGTIITFDSLSGNIELTMNDSLNTNVVGIIDFQTNVLQLSNYLTFEGVVISERTFGNAFYDEGLIVLESVPNFNEYTLNYNSTQTLYETEVLLSVDVGEFNYSQNPSATITTVSSIDTFETTEIPNVEPAGTVNIKQIDYISRKPTFTGSYGSSIGTWDDYFESKSLDPTGSYLAPYITTIGLFDDENQMIAVAKLPTPIKNLPDYNLNFIVRYDT